MARLSSICDSCGRVHPGRDCSGSPRRTGGSGRGRGGRSTTERGYGAAWRTLRRQAFEVYGSSCWWCGAQATTIDHLIELRVDSMQQPTINDVRPACRSCNYSHRTLRRRKGAGNAE